MTDPDDRRRKQRTQRDLVVTKAIRNRDATRRKLLAQGRELAQRRAENVERLRTRDDGSGTTEPGGRSTRPPVDTNEEAAARHAHSTVPERPKGSTVPAADRLYGLRLHERIRADAEPVQALASEDDVATAVQASPDAATPDDPPTGGGDGDE